MKAFDLRVFAAVTGAATIGLASALFVPTSATPLLCTTGTVGPIQNQTTHDCFATIQAGLNAANSGDAITVDPGTYAENITIATDGVSLRSVSGRKNTTIIGTGASSVVFIQANNVTFGGVGVGFTIRNRAPSKLPASYRVQGVEIRGTTAVSVVDNRIDGLVAGATAPAANTTFGRVVGVSATNSTGTTVQDNEIEGLRTATAAGSDVLVIGILISGSSTGATLRHNEVEYLFQSGGDCPGTGAIGIAIEGGSTASVSDSKVRPVVSTCLARGIRVGSSASGGTVSIVGNEVSTVISSAGRSAGIAVEPAGATVDVRRNLVHHNGIGVDVTSAPGAPLGLNAFLANGIGIRNSSGATIDATSNFWGCRGGPGTVACDMVMDVGAGSATTFSPFLPQKP